MITCVLLYVAGHAVPTGQQILQRCQQAYDSVRTFEEDVKGSLSGSSGTAHISFSRPDRLRVSGKTMFGAPYDLVSDRRSTWVLNGGNWSKVENVELGIATITGISANAGTLVPSALMHTSWGPLRGLLRSPGLKASTEKLNGVPAYRIQANGAMPMTLWIDAKTYFVMKTSTSVMGRTILVNFAKPVVNRPIPASRFKR